MRAKAFPGEDPAKPKDPQDVVPLFLALASPACTLHGEVHLVPQKAQAA